MRRAREEHAGRPELPDRRHRRPGSLESIEQQAHRTLNLLVGIQNQPPQRIVCKTDRRPQEEFSPARLVQDSTLQPRSQNMAFGFAHRAFQTEQKPVIEVSWIVDAVFIQDQGIGQRADLK